MTCSPRPLAALLFVSTLAGCGSDLAAEPAAESATVDTLDVPNPTVPNPTVPNPTVPTQPVTDIPAPSRPGSDWPLFLGPNGTGVVDDAELQNDLAGDLAAAPTAWTRPIGSGYSAPSVVGNRVLLFHRVGDEERLSCLRADTGQPLWDTARPSTFRDPYGYNNGPRCTPQIDVDGRYVITFGAGGRLMRTDLDTGRVAWEVDTAADFDVPRHFFGVGCTPIIETVGERQLVIALVGGQPDAGVVAFDAADGSVVWQSVGRDPWDGLPTRDRRGNPAEAYRWTGREMVVSYASPIAASIHGERHLLCLMRQGLVSLDPADGRVRFAYWFRSPIHESVNAARPVVVDDTILLSAPYNAGCVRLQVDAAGDGVTELWRTRDILDTHFSTAIHHDGHYYGFHGRHEGGGRLVCIDAATGEAKWSTDGAPKDFDPAQLRRGGLIDADGQPAPWPYFGRGSAILVGDRLLALGERATLAWVEATPEAFRETARRAVPETSYPSWAAPVLSRGRVFIRDEDSVVCLDLLAGPAPPE